MGTTTLAPTRTFGEQIADRRTANHATRADIADACDVSPQMVGYWERDVHLPQTSKLGALADALNVSPRTLGAWLEGSPLMYRPDSGGVTGLLRWDPQDRLLQAA